MDQLKTYMVIGFLAVCALMAGMLFKPVPAPEPFSLGGANELSAYGSNSQATTSTLAAGVGVPVVVEQTGRKYAVITNTGGTIAYLALNNTATSTAHYAAINDREYVIPLAANGGFYEINQNNLYTGQIIASSSAAVIIRAVQFY